MSRRWMKILMLPLFILISMFVSVNVSEDVFAKKVKAFDITVTKTVQKCTPGDAVIGENGQILSGSINPVCTPETSTGKVRIEATKKGYNVGGGNGGKMVNGIYFSGGGEKTLTVSRQGVVVKKENVVKIAYNSKFKTFRNNVEEKLKNTTFTDVTGDKYTFTVGKVESVKAEAKAADNTKTDASGDDDSGGDDEVTCMGAGGANTLGWIVCSVTEWLGSAANSAYSDIVEPSLQVDPKLFEGGDDGVRGGWETFRNIANVIFVILFLLVIFSQLTGYGIDNYGIKKVLPKLIVAAILINLSYWICLVFVDLSNILGNSFRALFDGLGATLGEPELDIAGAENVGDINTGAILSVAVLGALIVMVGSVWANPAIVISLLVAAMGVIISIFFLFILLSAREAAIIVLTVLSPIAVVLYALPNTKSIFDKWLKIFEGLLLVYPICGLLIGGGNYMSRLLLSAGFAGDGWLKALTAMIVGIVPIFFIPTVLKNSFAAMGSLGAKISGMGQRVSGAATGMARDSQGYKNMQERGLNRRTRIAAGLNRKGEETRVSRAVGRVLNFGRGGERSMAGNRLQYLKNQDAINRQNEMMGTGYSAARAGLEAQAASQAVSDYESLIMNDKVPGVNANDLGSVQRHHADMIKAYNNAGTKAEKDAALAQIKAAQNILSKSDAGRGMIEQNFQNAISDGNTAGLQEAAAHIMGEYGNTYKTKNRGEHAMMQDLASGVSIAGADGVAEKINSGAYATAGTDKYTPETLADADNGALDALIANMNRMNVQQTDNIKTVAAQALSKADSGNLSISQEARGKLHQIAHYQSQFEGPSTTLSINHHQ